MGPGNKMLEGWEQGRTVRTLPFSWWRGKLEQVIKTAASEVKLPMFYAPVIHHNTP